MTVNQNPGEVTAETNKDCTCPPMWPLEHVGAHHPKCLLRSKPVTGPDGDNPLTDEQIRELLREAEGVEGNDVDLARLCTYALGWGPASDGMRQHARAQCATAWNARHAKEVDRG